MPRYLREPVDDLPFGNEEKARRYASERYTGAVGRNWYACDPSLQFLMRAAKAAGARRAETVDVAGDATSREDVMDERYDPGAVELPNAASASLSEPHQHLNCRRRAVTSGTGRH